MRSLAIAVFLVSLTAGLAGCGTSAESPSSAGVARDPNAEIRTAVLAHLAQKGTLNLQAFDTSVKEVTFQDDHAQAEVEFRVKNGPGTMSLSYQLQKRDGTWSVIEANPAGSDFSHPGLNQDQAIPPTNQGSSNSSLADTIKSLTTGGAVSPSPASTPTPAPK